MLVRREAYLKFLHEFKDQSIIKVISGVRRAGKSTLLEIFRTELQTAEVEADQIIDINFESIENEPLTEYHALYDYVNERLQPTKMNYVFLDEIQNVPEFEKVVDALHIKPNVDLYITGSNAFFMSGELATLLSGRYVELKILPLSFSEFKRWHTENELTVQTDRDFFNEYLGTAFPQTLTMQTDANKRQYLSAVYDSVLLKDVVTRLKITDVDALQRIVRYLMSVVGSPVSINKIKNTFVSNGKSISNNTITRYVTGLESALLFYKVPRYKVRGRELLKTSEKYYTVDLGLRRILLPDANVDFGHVIENVVFLELKRRGYTVYVGNIDEYEIDFVALDDQQNVTYYQVSLTTLDENTLARELRPLQKISDAYPRYLITMDDYNREANYDGIQKVHLLDWLQNK
ncbi:MAG: ATP-binding protein [Lactobacillaceae bacterium]|jgi:predicted AAA+ superfamily ATPase|nr:ATP-binding protein [Lactobacillaceae bacterium]